MTAATIPTDRLPKLASDQPGEVAQQPMVDAALNYAHLGVPVFPCSAQNKKPLTPNGFRNASTDEARIRQWWGTWPTAMIGVPTGAPSKYVVLDVDQDDTNEINGEASLMALVKANGPLPETACQITPRGGRHFLFAHPGRRVKNSAGKLGRGLDIRGDGGYVVMAPSVSANGVPYRWQRTPEEGIAPLPDWLLALIAPEPAPKAAAKSNAVHVSAGNRHRYGDAALKAETQAVRTAEVGTRNDTLNKAAYALGGLVAAGVLPEAKVMTELLQAAVDLVAEDGEAAVRATIMSGLTAGKAAPREIPEPRTRRQGKDKAPDSEPHDDGRPTIRVTGGRLPQVVDQAERHLIAAELGLYQRGNLIVRAAEVPIRIADGKDVTGTRLVSVKNHAIAEAMTRAANWLKYDKRSAEWVAIDCPPRVADTYLAREGGWKLPVLTGVIQAPTLRPDGSILDRPGYDHRTGLILAPGKATFPPLPQAPTRADAIGALGVLRELISTFPFVGNADRSVALSAILTATVRRSIGTAPMHAFTAPVRGSGKSMLVDIAAMIPTGRPAPVISQGKTEEEMEKRLGAALIAGDQIISIDNAEQGIGGELICQVLTQQFLKVRVLGKSINTEVPSNAFITATGNNLQIVGDMTRRTLLCSLDPQCERPELREFSGSPLDRIAADRGRYVTAALTVLRAFHLAGRPRLVALLGSFEEWSDWVRCALIWCDETDPCATMDNLHEADPKREAATAVLQQWAKIIGKQRVSVKDVIEAATMRSSTSGMLGRAEFAHPDFREALLVVAGDGGAVNSRKLGKWLSAHSGRIFDGISIDSDGMLDGIGRGRLKSHVPF